MELILHLSLTAILVSSSSYWNVRPLTIAIPAYNGFMVRNRPFIEFPRGMRLRRISTERICWRDGKPWRSHLRVNFPF